VALQSRGVPIEPPADARLLPWRERGEALYRERIGQLNLSCAQCHDERAGQRLGGGLIPQGHANGYPLYRLEWQGVGSLLRRIRNCMTGVRAQPLPAESPEFTALALYLAWRDRGMAMESPAVRP
jgi:sulfur-oxidizing protein SoxA